MNPVLGDPTPSRPATRIQIFVFDDLLAVAGNAAHPIKGRLPTAESCNFLILH
jgi:hypothetical protein